MENFVNDGSIKVDASPTRATVNELEEFFQYDITVLAEYNTIEVPSSSMRVMTWSDSK